MIPLGQFTNQSVYGGPAHIFAEEPDLSRHVGTPWLRAYLEKNLGVSLDRTRIQAAGTTSVDAQSLARHTLVCGGTGGGKSRLIEHLVIEQIRRGCSAVVIDPKAETVEHLISHLEELGFPPERVTVVSPRLSAGVPGWNPFLAGIPVTQAAGDFVAVLERSTSSWGPRMQDLLTNAAIVVGAHRLSLYELARLLLREDYRAALLRLPAPDQESLAYEEARSYFLEEFATWNRGERAQAVAPVLNKLRELLRSSFLRPLLCAKRNTIDLGKLWHRPHVILIHLDRTSLGDEGARLLGGLLTNLLFRTALRARGSVPVVLALDELATVEHFVGEALADVVTVARSQGLRLLVACQHLAQLSEGLRGALLGNAAVQAFFRLGHADARLVAASLAAGTDPWITRVAVRTDGRDRYTGEAPSTQWTHPIRDPYGRPLRLDEAGWQRVCRAPEYYRTPVETLRKLAPSLGVSRLYVHAADTAEPVELRRYIAKLPTGECRIQGPTPVELVITFPRPRVGRVDRANERDSMRNWTGVLQELPVQHAVIRIAGAQAGVVKIVDIPTPARANRRDFVRASSRANGQTPEEAQAIYRWRSVTVDNVSAGHSPSVGAPEEQSDDGSIA